MTFVGARSAGIALSYKKTVTKCAYNKRSIMGFIDRPIAQNVRALSIDGKRFQITLCEETARLWHWIIAAPGDLALSGEAASELQALNSACQAGRILARRGEI
jgi:hypothetical protein